MSDFSLIMEDDVLRCTTHFRRLKCDLKIDNSSSTVIVSGVGHNIWREDFFPVIARLLFAQFVEFADSHVCDFFVDERADGRSKALDKCTIDPTKAKRITEVVQQALRKDRLQLQNLPMIHLFLPVHPLLTERRHAKT